MYSHVLSLKIMLMPKMHWQHGMKNWTHNIA